MGDRPVTKRCVGDPPRQTEDPLAPPCVAHFEGDNGGATYQGVTRDEVVVLVYFEGNTTEGVSRRGSELKPSDTYFDLFLPEDEENENILVSAVRDFQTYFNNRYQTYGRRLHFWV